MEAGAEERFHGLDDAKLSSENQEHGDEVGSNTILLASSYSHNYPLTIMRNRKKRNLRDVITSAMSAGYCITGVILLLNLAGCTSTRINVSYHDKAYPGGPLKKVMVMGVSADSKERQFLEDQLVNRLSSRGIKSIPSYKAFPGAEKPGKVEMEQEIKDLALNALIVARFVSGKGEESGSSRIEFDAPQTADTSLYNQYERFYDAAHSPGFLEDVIRVNLETNIYDGESGSLVWTASSEAFNPDTIEDAITSISSAIVDRLSRDGLL